MIQNMSLVAVIPARGGSKGIPGKNLYRLAGMSLVERAIHIGRSCKRVDQILVSTDHPEIYGIAQENGCATPSLRPESLSTDFARTVDVISNLVSEGVVGLNDCVILLQPSSPFRSQAHIDKVCDLLEANWCSTDAVVSVSEIDGPHPYKAQVVRNGYLQSLLCQDSTVPRQTLPDTFIPNGAFYLVKVAVLLEENTFMPTRTMPYYMNSIESLNLDGPIDLLLLETIVDRGMVEFGDDGARIIQSGDL